MKYLLLSLLLGCGFQYAPGPLASKVGGLGGRVLPLSGIVFDQSWNSYSLIESAYASTTCTGNVWARIYKINIDGTLDQTIVSSTEVTDGAYMFETATLPLDIYDPLVRYQIMVEGCDDVFARPITEVDENQDVTYSSTVVGLTVQAETTKPISQTTRADIATLIESLSGSSVIDALNILNNSPALSNKFQTTFLSLPTILMFAHPTVTVLNFPAIIGEGSTSTFKISGVHFNNTYAASYEWHLDGALALNHHEWNYTPGADSAGSYVVTFYAGQNDGNGLVDRTKPFLTRSKVVTILDTLPSVAPNISLTANISSSTTVDVRVQTGTALTNCTSFNSFLLTDSATKPLASDPGFSLTCNTPRFLES